MPVCMYVCMYVYMYVYFPHFVLVNSKQCRFSTGNGIGPATTGSSEKYIGNYKSQACVDECLKQKANYTKINGVTIYTNETKRGCWCEMNMYMRNNNSYYKSCFLISTSK